MKRKQASGERRERSESSSEARQRAKRAQQARRGAMRASEASERGLMGLASEASKVRVCRAVCVETAFSQTALRAVYTRVGLDNGPSIMSHQQDPLSHLHIDPPTI